MKRVILPIVFIAVSLALVGGLLVLIDGLTYVPENDYIFDTLRFDADGVSEIAADTEASFLTIYKLNSGESFAVDIVAPDKDAYSVGCEDGVLCVSEKNKSWIEAIRRADSGRYGVSIGVPDGAHIILDLKCGDGSVDVDDIDAESVAITTVGGSVSLGGVKSVKDASIVTESGKIEILSVSASGISAETASGSISANGVSAGDITLRAHNGSIRVDGVVCGSFDASADVGDIEFSGVESGSITLTVGEGDINGTLIGARGDYTIDASADDGECTLNNGGSGVPFTANVGVGNIRVFFEKQN